jgi:hypothetical protein
MQALDTRLGYGRLHDAARKGRWFMVALTMVGIAAIGCVYNAQDRCGPNRTLLDDWCVCLPGTVEKNGKVDTDCAPGHTCQDFSQWVPGIPLLCAEPNPWN